MAKRTKKTHPERAVLKGSGGEYVVTKIQMLFETTKLLAKKFLKLFEATIENYLTDESNVFIPQFFVECFHILSSFSTPSTFDAQNINT